MLRAGFVTLVAILLIGSLLYYAFHRSEMAERHQREKQASQAGQQQAVAVSRVFASLSSAVLQADVAKMQELLGTWRVKGLADVMLIDTGDRVLAASNPAYVGQQMRDAGWASIRAQSREWVFLDEPAPGQERVTVFEPVMDKGSIIAWARVSFLRARGDVAVRTPEDRLRQVAWLLVPVCVVLAGLVGLAMRLATTIMQQRIKSVMVQAMADRPMSPWGAETLDLDEATTDSGTHRAA